MDFEIPEHIRMLKHTIKRFMDTEVIPLEREYHDDELPLEVEQALVVKVKDLGLWQMHLPKEFGGAGFTNLEMLPLQEEMSKSILYAGFGSMFIFGRTPPPQLFAASKELMDEFFWPTVRGEMQFFFAQTEAGTSGSDPGSMETTAVKDGAYWIVNGSKYFISHVHRAQYGILFAVTDKQKRQHGGITAFLIDRDTPGWSVARRIETLGGPGRSPSELVFDDCRIHESRVLGRPGEGFGHAQRILNANRISSGGALGKAERALEMTIEFAKNRSTWGKPIAERQAIQWMLVDSKMEIESCRWLSYYGAWKADQGEDIRIEASMNKVMSTEMLWRVVDRCLQIYGGAGFTTDLPLESMLRNARGSRITEGTNEIHRWIIARKLLDVGRD